MGVTIKLLTITWSDPPSIHPSSFPRSNVSASLKKTCDASGQVFAFVNWLSLKLPLVNSLPSAKMQRFLFMEKKQNGSWLCNNSKRGMDVFIWIFVWIISCGFSDGSFHMDFSDDLHSEPTDGLHIKETKKATIFTQRNHVGG